MADVKGCDLTLLSEKAIKKENFAEGFEEVITKEQLCKEIMELLKPFTDYEGKVEKTRLSGRAYAFYKKIDKKKKLIAVALIKRIARQKEEKEGLAKLFQATNDVFEWEKIYQLPGYEQEVEWFEKTLLNDMRQAVAFGEVREAYCGEKTVQLKNVRIMGHTITSTAFFVLMMVVWGIVFHNMALGIAFAMCFTGSFTLVTGLSRADVVEQEKQDDKNEKTNGEE